MQNLVRNRKSPVELFVGFCLNWRFWSSLGLAQTCTSTTKKCLPGSNHDHVCLFYQNTKCQKSQKKRYLHFYKIKQISANCVNLWNICQFVQIDKPGARPHVRRLTWNGHLLKAAVKALRYVFGNLKPRKKHWNPCAAVKLL